MLLPQISSNINSEKILNKGLEFVKEVKETSSIAMQVIKSVGLENVPTSDLITKTSTSDQSQKISVIKRMDLPILHKGERVIPLCGAEINAEITAKNSLGDVFFQESVDFILGKFQLPVGLEKSITRMTSSHEYHAIVPASQAYFIKEPSEEVVKLKNVRTGKTFTSYAVKLNKISKSFPVGSFEPRIFYMAYGIGDEIFCESSVKATFEISNLDGKIVTSGKDYLINIGEGNFPHGIEHLLMRLRGGDKVSVMLHSDWFKADTNSDQKIILPKSQYLIFDITIQSVKQSENMFRASKVPSKEEISLVQRLNKIQRDNADKD